MLLIANYAAPTGRADPYGRAVRSAHKTNTGHSNPQSNPQPIVGHLPMISVRLALAAAVGLAEITVPATAQELYGTLKKVRDDKVFTIGHREASVGFSYYDESKKPVGFAVEY